MNAKHEVDRIELGLAISGATLAPGKRRSLTEMAAFCDCTKQALHHIETGAMRKLKRRLIFILRKTGLTMEDIY